MMQRHALRLVLLVSCAHALVHLFELSLPSVELEIAGEFHPDSPERGKELSGRLSNYWRLLWGLGALVAGWLVDRFGGRPMLAIYLIGCAGACFLAAFSRTTIELTTGMLIMGAFASIYHPAGLALIANETQPENRPRALGLHGILGSVGIGSAPLLAWIALTAGLSWRTFFAAIALPAIVLGIVFFTKSRRSTSKPTNQQNTRESIHDEERARWIAFATLTCLAFLQGFVYAAQMSFLPRYLSTTEVVGNDELTASEQIVEDRQDDQADDETEWRAGSIDSSKGRLLASLALLCGCIGQFVAGRIARHDRLEIQIALITLANVPFLIWMAFASDWQRPAAACLFALIHFMHQPIYNSLIPKYTPRRRRSLCYGISISIGLGCGSVGASFAGAFMDDIVVYLGLSMVSFLAFLVGIVLWLMNRRDLADGPPGS